MLAPNLYIESLYAAQGMKVVCQSVELGLDHSALHGKELEGTFRIINCSEPEKLKALKGFEFLNFYMEHRDAVVLGFREKTKVQTGTVDFYFYSRGSEAMAGLIQSFAAQFSKEA